jgi:hypothetical protein
MTLEEEKVAATFSRALMNSRLVGEAPTAVDATCQVVKPASCQGVMARQSVTQECHTETTQGRTRFGTRVGSKLPWVAMGIVLEKGGWRCSGSRSGSKTH